MYIYRFVNKFSKVIYVGRTNNIIRRLRKEHFTKRGHLPQECYNQTESVEYASVENLNQAMMFELYYIEKFHPKYNQSDIGGGAFGVELDELSWQTFDFNTDTHTKTKKQIIDTITAFTQEFESESRFFNDILRDQDSKPWLTKLTTDERNEYLKFIYSTERFTRNIQTLNDTVKNNIV